MLHDEITNAKRSVNTDAYQMSIGEVVSLYDEQELIINPEFQRLFRWTISQKSKLIESLLLGIPIPSIFVFEKDDGKWELVDGLQRVSTVLEFMGRLRSPDGGAALPPSLLEATKYLPSLHNTVWEASELIEGTPVADQVPVDKSLQLSIRRARLGVEILKRPSQEQTKFDLFQRLNAGGTQANPQELRNCIMLMVNGHYYQAVKGAADMAPFQAVTAFSEDQVDRQRHMEYAVRFLVHTLVPYDGKLDVEEYIDEGIVELATQGNGQAAASLINRTFGLLSEVAGANALRRYEGNSHTGRVTLVGLEGIAVGVAKNIDAIEALGGPQSKEFVEERLKAFWSQSPAATFTSPGLRGTIRIQRTVPFGASWFQP